MAPKRSSLLEDPPAASSSEEEEVESGEEEEEEATAEGGGAAQYESDSDDFDKSTSSGEFNNSPKSAKAPNLNSTPKPQTPSSSESDNDDEDENESEDSDDDDNKSLKPSDLYRTSTPIVKPKQSVVAEKPIAKKSVAKPTPSTSVPPKTPTAGKRPLEAEKGEKEKEKDSKRKKKKVEDGDGDDEDGSQPEGDKKPIDGSDQKTIPFQRVWSDDDELVILKGMRDSIKKGIDPTSDLDDFLDSIQKSIHINASRDQLNNKIRRLKKKYLNNCKRGKEGEDPSFSKPHDIKCFELMKEIWGGQERIEKERKSKKSNDASNGNEELALTNGKRSRKPTAKSGAASPRPKTVALADIPLKESVKIEEKSLALYPCLSDSIQSDKTTALGESIYKEGLRMIGDSKAKELEQKWRKLQTAELEIRYQRVELERDQLKAVLDVVKSSDS